MNDLISVKIVSFKAIDIFLDKFFEQNPIAQVGVILCKDRKAERYVSLTGTVPFMNI